MLCLQPLCEHLVRMPLILVVALTPSTLSFCEQVKQDTWVHFIMNIKGTIPKEM